MKKITIELDNPTVESVLYNLSKEQNKSIENIAADLLNKIVDILNQEKQIELKYKTFDPEEFMTKINYNLDTINEKFDFTELAGKLEWKGNSLLEQKLLRNEWE